MGCGMWRRLLLASTCSSLVLSACGTPTTAPEDHAAAFSGVVVDVRVAPAVSGKHATLPVVHPGQPKPADRSIVHISAATAILKRTPKGDVAPGTVEDIRVGHEARFDIDDVELRSYPPHVHATRVELQSRVATYPWRPMP